MIKNLGLESVGIKIFLTGGILAEFDTMEAAKNMAVLMGGDDWGVFSLEE